MPPHHVYFGLNILEIFLDRGSQSAYPEFTLFYAYTSFRWLAQTILAKHNKTAGFSSYLWHETRPSRQIQTLSSGITVEWPA